MNINTLFEKIKDALSNDPEILAWSNLYYSQDHKVYANIDIRKPPAEADCPYIAFYPDNKTVGSFADRKRHVFLFICCIFDSSLSVGTETNVVEYVGVKRIEDFRKLCEDALSDMDIGNVMLDLIEIDYETIESFPFMLAAMSVNFGEAQLISVDPLE